MSSTGIYCFGYGSLVNRDTHIFDTCQRSSLINWRRRWSHRVNGQRSVTSLSIEPSSGSEILGLVAWVPEEQVLSLDQRESGYSKKAVAVKPSAADGPALPSIVTYISNAHADGDDESPILQSYLDAVLKGFLSEFGESGVRHFMQTTEGWNAPVLRDRHEPFYPRSVSITSEEAYLFDSEVDRLAVRWIG